MAPQVDPALVPELDGKVDGFLSALMAAQTRSPEFAQQAANVRAMGDADIRRAAETSNRLLQTPVRALKEGGIAEGSKVGNTLLELRRRVEDLDPSRATGTRKFLGMIPFGDKITDYFRRYESAQGHLNGILHALRNGQDELTKDNVALNLEKQNLWGAMGRLNAYIYVADALLGVPRLDGGRRGRLRRLDAGRSRPTDQVQRAAARQRHLPRMLGSRRPPSEALTDLRAAYARIYRAVAEVTSCDVVVDASKGPALGQALAGSAGIDLRILNVVRDPRAVAWSWQRRVERPHATNGTEQMWRIPAHRAAAQWSTLQLEMAAIAGLGGVRSARLHYEDFVADPVGTLVEATAALGVPLSAVRPPDRRRGPGRPRAQPRPGRQPSEVPLRHARAPPRRRMDHRDVVGGSGGRHRTHAASAEDLRLSSNRRLRQRRLPPTDANRG